MSFEDQITSSLVSIAHDALDQELFLFVEDLANFLRAIKTGRWKQLPIDEQTFWIKKLRTRISGPNGMAELLGYENPLLLECLSILSNEEKTLRRAK